MGRTTIRSAAQVWTRAGPICDLALALVLALALRLPTILSRVPIGFDDGVYLASAMAMRQGEAPFRSVYSSQGPLFLPLVWAADLLSLRSHWGARLLPLLAGMALVVAVHRLALLVADRTGAMVAALLTATSGTLLFTTTRVEADPVAAAFGAWALVAAIRARGTWGLLQVAGLLGAALAVKSLMAGPALLAVAVLLWRRYGIRVPAAVLAGSGAVVLALALPWGFHAVWEQSVLLHLSAREHASFAGNLPFLGHEVAKRDDLFMGIGLAAVGAVAIAWVARRPSRAQSDVADAVWVWAAAAVALTLLHAPLFVQHVTVLVAPAAVLVGRYRPPLPVLLVVGALFLPAQAAAGRWGAPSPAAGPKQMEVADLLRGIEPRGSEVLADYPALAWMAGRTIPGRAVDPSLVRIDAGQLTSADMAREAHRQGVCAVLAWTGRFDHIDGIELALADYRTVFRDGAQRLLLRPGCEIDGHPPLDDRAASSGL